MYIYICVNINICAYICIYVYVWIYTYICYHLLKWCCISKNGMPYIYIYNQTCSSSMCFSTYFAKASCLWNNPVLTYQNKFVDITKNGFPCPSCKSIYLHKPHTHEKFQCSRIIAKLKYTSKQVKFSRWWYIYALFVCFYYVLTFIIS